MFFFYSLRKNVSRFYYYYYYLWSPEINRKINVIFNGTIDRINIKWRVYDTIYVFVLILLLSLPFSPLYVNRGTTREQTAFAITSPRTLTLSMGFVNEKKKRNAARVPGVNDIIQLVAFYEICP